MNTLTKKIVIVALFSLICSFCSCSTPGSITIGGSYDGISGNITYDWNPKKSDESGKPILTDEKGKDSVLLGESDLSDLWERVKEKIGLKEVKGTIKPDTVLLVKYLFPKKK